METRHNAAQPVSTDDLPKLTVGENANTVVSPNQSHHEPTDLSCYNKPEVTRTSSSNHDKDQVEDAGEVVEGDEDTVIY